MIRPLFDSKIIMGQMSNSLETVWERNFSLSKKIKKILGGKGFIIERYLLFYN